MKTRATKTTSLALARQSAMGATDRIKFICSGLIILSILTIVCVMSATAQESSGQPQQQTNTAGSQQGGRQKEFVGPTADSILPYRPSGRDPFKSIAKPKAAEKKSGPRPIEFPNLDARRAEFRQKAEVARLRDLPEPNPVAQYLVSELVITGIFRDERGNGAFVQAQPTGTMFFIRRGTQCYNGEVLRIETDESDGGGAKVLFREVSYIEVNGKRSPQERVVGKLPGAPESKK